MYSSSWAEGKSATARGFSKQLAWEKTQDSEMEADTWVKVHSGIGISQALGLRLESGFSLGSGLS